MEPQVVTSMPNSLSDMSPKGGEGKGGNLSVTREAGHILAAIIWNFVSVDIPRFCLSSG